MILSRHDYEYYLEADRVALRIPKNVPWYMTHEIHQFQCLMRKCEFLKNCHNGVLGRALFYYFRYRYEMISIRLGYSIPLNVFGPGLSIAHRGPIVVHRNARIGSNCRIHICVCVGTNGGSSKAPQIGDNVYIGPGSKLFGDIEIGDGIAIGANAMVNRSFTQPNITIGGIPARKVSSKGSHSHLIRATELTNTHSI